MPRLSWPAVRDVIGLYKSTGIVPDPTQTPFADAVETALSGNAAAGASTLPVASSIGFSPGDTILVGANSAANFEAATVMAIPDGLHLGISVLAFAHASAEAVTRSAINWGETIEAAPATLARATGRVFIAQAATRVYDPPTGPRGVLDLVADLCSDPDASPAISVTLNGVNQVINTDIYLGPENNDQAGLPWRTIEFAEAFPSDIFLLQRKSIAVTGCWGYSLQVPDDVWQACVEQAALLAMPQVVASVSRGRAEAQTEHFRYRFAGGGVVGPLDQQARLWQADVERVMARYKKVDMF